MKTKTILFVMVALLFLIGGVGCEDDNGSDVPKKLIGTWKCVGFGDTKTGEVIPIELKDCEKCYTLTLKEDGTFEGKSTANSLIGKYKINNTSFTFVEFGGTKIYELNDGQKFIESLSNTISYSDNNNELLLRYSEHQYLLFNPKD